MAYLTSVSLFYPVSTVDLIFRHPWFPQEAHTRLLDPDLLADFCCKEVWIVRRALFSLFSFVVVLILPSPSAEKWPILSRFDG